MKDFDFDNIDQQIHELDGTIRLIDAGGASVTVRQPGDREEELEPTKAGMDAGYSHRKMIESWSCSGKYMTRLRIFKYYNLGSIFNHEYNSNIKTFKTKDFIK